MFGVFFMRLAPIWTFLIIIGIVIVIIVIVAALERIAKAIQSGSTTSSVNKVTRGKGLQYCRYCGEAMEKNAMYCPSCGRATSGRMAPYLSADTQDAQPIQQIPIEPVSDDDSVPTGNIPVSDHETEMKSVDAKPRRRFPIIAIIIIVLVGAGFLTYTLLKNAAYNDAVYAYNAMVTRAGDYSDLEIGGKSIFRVKKLGITFYFRLEDGELKDCRRLDAPAAPSFIDMTIGSVSFSYQCIATDEQIAEQQRRGAYRNAFGAYTTYQNNNIKSNRKLPTGSVIEVTQNGT